MYQLICPRVGGSGNLDGHDANMFVTGNLNLMWQSWNRFWRIYWLAQIFGGVKMDKSKIVPLSLSYKFQTENEAIFYLLFLLGKKRYPRGVISGSHQEPTWGAPKVIEDIALLWSNDFSHVLNALSIYGDIIKHFQIVRNAAIHTDKDNINNVKINVMPYYRVTNISHPVDILFSDSLTTGKPALVTWREDLRAMLFLV